MLKQQRQVAGSSSDQQLGLPRLDIRQADYYFVAHAEDRTAAHWGTA